MKPAEMLAAALSAALASSGLAGAISASRTNAAKSLAGLIKTRAEQFPDAYPAAFRDASTVYEVRGVDEMGKDIEDTLAAVLNGDRNGQPGTAVIFITGTANKGYYLKKLAKDERDLTGRPTAGVALFARDVETRKQPWVLVNGIDPGPAGDAQTEKAGVIAGLTAKIRADETEIESTLAGDDGPLAGLLARLRAAAESRAEPSGLAKLLADLTSDEATSGCKGCCTGLFTSGTKSVYMKFCPGDALGEVLSAVAPHLGAVGQAPITIAPVSPEDVPGDVVVISMES